ncbi:hypothetical protein RSOLAG22IIIB_07518 [Rhizoctonia solani]|uniref:F-box domain-containing protein n=1 Tax=Rhizoctonia solani TaxID=456999 RepID=A0A0K6FNU9_9AGAM|nr:hypothetical protein RSOLAG22IIIB_07518 [Rhizoctonia solani]
MEMNRFSFSCLPDELVIHMLHYCHFKQILRFAITSKRNHAIVATSTSLRLHIELESHDLEIAGYSPQEKGATCSEILAEFLQYQAVNLLAWRNLKFSGPIERTPGQRPTVCQWSEGNYVVGYRSRPDSLTTQYFDSLQIMPLTSFEHFSPLILENEFTELMVDANQNLGVFGRWELQSSGQKNAQLEIALISLKTGHPHPLAQISKLHIQLDFDYDPSSTGVNLDVMHDILSIELKNYQEEFFETLVWDWKSGCFLMRIKSNSESPSSCYFDEVHLGVLVYEPTVDGQGCYSRQISLSLYRIPSHSNKEVPSGNLFRASSYPCARPTVAFLFPELDKSHYVMNNDFFSDPVPGRVLPLDKVTLAHSSMVTFTLNLTLDSVDDEDDGPIHFRIFVSARHLHRYVPEHMYTASRPTTLVPWELWGTEATRWFLWNNPNSDDIEWGLWTYGSRFLHIRNEPDSTLHDLSVIDFAPRTAMDAHDNSLALQRTPEYKQRLERIVSEGKMLISAYAKNAFEGELPPVFADTIGSDIPTTIKTGFAAPVESRLPYRVVTRPQFLPTCEDWTIDANHIIGLYPGGREDGTILVHSLHHNSDPKVA